MMTASERLAEIEACFRCNGVGSRREEEAAAPYIAAIRNRDEAVLALYDEFNGGQERRNLGRILDNARKWRRMQLFGFRERRYDEYGWLKAEPVSREEIALLLKGRSIMENSINIAEFPDHSWTGDFSWSIGNEGCSGLASVWDERKGSRKEAIRAAAEGWKKRCISALSRVDTDERTGRYIRSVMLPAADAFISEQAGGVQLEFEFDFD